MAVPFSNTKIRTPGGFRNVIWVLAREIIRDDPEDIVQYAADFFEKLLVIRSETDHDPAVQGAHAEDRFYNNYAFKVKSSEVQEEEQQSPPPSPPLPPSPPPSPLQEDQQAGASKPEEEAIDIDLNDPAVEEAAIKIQAQFKGFMARKDKQKEESQ